MSEIEMKPPNLLLSLSEVHRAAIEVASLSISRPALDRAPTGDGHPVVVLPGFMGADGYSLGFRRWLNSKNYAVHGWGLGRNLGPREGILDALEARLHFLVDQYQGPISLVGHSLGGIFAREIARRHPQWIRQVVSLGSPFGKGRMTGSLPARLFTALNPPEKLPIDEAILHEAPPVPTTAIYSRGDGIVNWQTTHQQEGHERTQSIRIRGSHCGMTLNPTVWFLVAERLSQPAEDWKPFSRTRWARVFYPQN